MQWVERKNPQPSRAISFIPCHLIFLFLFLNNNVFLKLRIWVTHYYGNVLFCFERKGKTQSIPRLPDEKVNQPVKTHRGSGKKQLRAHVRELLYHRHPFHMWSSGSGERPAHENIPNKKQRKLRRLGFSQAVILKCNLFEGFISQAYTQSASRHCFPTLHPSWTCYWAKH